MTYKKIVSALVVVCAAYAGSAQASLVFQSAAQNGASSRTAGSGIMTRFQVASAVDLTNISAKMNLVTAGNIEFVIFNAASGQLLFTSGPAAYADDGDTFKMSGAFNFTMLPGTTYSLGALSDVASVQDFITPGGKTMGAITSLGGNLNATGFASPVLSASHGATDGIVQLFARDSVNVPEPGSFALLALGLVSCLALRRKR